jgi:UBA/TS-N domain
MLGIKTANPRSVVSLSEMGYPQELCALALQKCENDIEIALNLLQLDLEGLKAELVNVIKPDDKLIDELVSLGYDENLAVYFLKHNINDFQKTLDALLDMQKNNQLPPELEKIVNSFADGPSTSSGTSTFGLGTDSRQSEAKKRRHEKEELEALDGLRNDLMHLDETDEYLMFTLKKEQAFLAQYRNALNQ